MSPIKPSEVGKHQLVLLPDFVMEAFNGMIASRCVNGRAKFTQDEVITAIIACCTTQLITRKMVFDNHWLDIEAAYREMGWKVEYTKPDYTESFDPYFEFTVKR